MEYTFTQVIRDESIDPFEAFFQGGSGYYEVDTLVKSNHVEIKIDQKETKSNSMEFQEEPTDINYAIVIDRSSSLMAKTDSLSPSFMNLENEFFNQMKKDEVQKILNITCFASKPHFFRLSEINNLETIIPSEGKDGSAIYDAILATVIRGGTLQSGNYPFSILLLTDGADNSSRLSKSTLTNILLQNKIRVDVVAFVSTKDSVYYNFEVPSGGAMIKNEQNFTDVEEIAKATNGLFVLVENKKQISSAIRKIKKQMQKVNSSMRKPEDDFHPDENMLITLYNSILLDAESEF